MSLYVRGRREVAAEASRDSQRWSNLDQRRSRFAAADSFSFLGAEDVDANGFLLLLLRFLWPLSSSSSSCFVKYS